MKIRKTQPSNNKYYIRTLTGGLNLALAGEPTIEGANVLCNCVGYANGRFNEIINDPELTGIGKAFKYQLVCDAEDFIESAKHQGLKISKTPTLGGIMVWQKGSLMTTDGAGHVAVVERLYDDGSILTSESGFRAFAFKTVRRDNDNGRWSQADGYKFRGCVVNPYVKDVITKAPKLKIDGVGGNCTVRAMQRFFGTPKDGVISGQTKKQAWGYPSIKAVEYGDGGSTVVRKLQKWLGLSQTGKLNDKTIKAWQKKIGVEADGVFGSDSMKVWQKYLNEHDKATYTNTDDRAMDYILSASAKKKTDNAQKIVDKATEYCWKYGTKAKYWSYAKGHAKAAYKKALKKYMNKRAKISQSDCGYLVSTCVRAAGISKTFNCLHQFGKCPKTMKIVLSGKKVPKGFLKKGDIVRWKKKNGGQHTIIIYGNGKTAEAGRGHWFPRIRKNKKQLKVLIT